MLSSPVYIYVHVQICQHPLNTDRVDVCSGEKVILAIQLTIK